MTCIETILRKGVFLPAIMCRVEINALLPHNEMDNYEHFKNNKIIKKNTLHNNIAERSR